MEQPQLSASEQYLLLQLQEIKQELLQVRKIVTPVEEDPFEKIAIMEVAKAYGRNTAALTRRAEAKGWVIKIPGKGNVNYIERRHANALVKKAS